MNNLKYKISVIVPIYNAEKYLKRCVDSIVNQSYKNLEIILVDDGSPDGCPELCDTFAKTDKRIKVLHKPNGGVSSARNEGLKIATGDFVTFVDSDDYILEDYIEKSASMIDEKIDLVVAGQHIIDDNKNVKITTPETNFNSPALNNINDFMKFLIDGHFDIVVNKLYKRNLITSEFLKNQPLGEDRIFNLSYFKNIKNKIATIDNPGYVYEFNTSSACHKKRDNLFDILEVPLIKLKEFLISKFNTCNNQLFFKLLGETMFYSYTQTSPNTKKTTKQKIIKSELFKDYIKGYKPDTLKKSIKKLLFKLKMFRLLEKLTK